MLRFFHQIMSEKTTERLVSLPFFVLYLPFFAFAVNFSRILSTHFLWVKFSLKGEVCCSGKVFDSGYIPLIRPKGRGMYPSHTINLDEQPQYLGEIVDGTFMSFICSIQNMMPPGGITSGGIN
jgi:hypothetical protein